MKNNKTNRMKTSKRNKRKDRKRSNQKRKRRNLKRLRPLLRRMANINRNPTAKANLKNDRIYAMLYQYAYISFLLLDSQLLDLLVDLLPLELRLLEYFIS